MDEWICKNTENLIFCLEWNYEDYYWMCPAQRGRRLRSIRVWVSQQGMEEKLLFTRHLELQHIWKASWALKIKKARNKELLNYKNWKNEMWFTCIFNEYQAKLTIFQRDSLQLALVSFLTYAFVFNLHCLRVHIVMCSVICLVFGLRSYIMCLLGNMCGHLMCCWVLWFLYVPNISVAFSSVDELCFLIV